MTGRRTIGQAAGRVAYTCMVFALGVTAARGEWQWVGFFLVSALVWGASLLVSPSRRRP